GTSSVEFGGFGGRDTPANSTLDAAPEAMRRHTRPGTRSDAPPHSRRHQKRRATTFAPAPDATRNHTRGGTTADAAPGHPPRGAADVGQGLTRPPRGP